MSDNKQKSKVVFLKGRKVNLRPFSKEDIPTITRWINDPETRKFVTMTFPQTEKQEEEWYNKLSSDDKNIVLGIETKDGKLIGIMGLHGINWVFRTGTTGAIIGEKSYRGKGYGTDAKMQFLNYAFNTLNLHKICSSVLAFNKRSLQYSRNCGYKKEGHKKRHVFKNGKYWSLIELGVFKENWLPKWKKYQRTVKAR
jgi:RimJ/RimL family protein N-acetyltransferase